MGRIWFSILTAFAVSYVIRVLPLTLIRKPIRNRFLRSFLYYVPYVTLAVMTFPAIVEATNCGGAASGAVFVEPFLPPDFRRGHSLFSVRTRRAPPLSGAAARKIGPPEGIIEIEEERRALPCPNAAISPST